MAISFVRADVTDLAALSGASFDVVYTGGHVAVWVADLEAYYSEASRVLKPGGTFMINEYHPFRRIWKPVKDRMEVKCHYFERGPFEYEMDDDILAAQPGSMKSYEFHWRISDFLNAVSRAGCQIEFADEFGEYVGGWEEGPVHGLPENLLIVALKASQR